jgi:pilus assembly protein Flp/PilA
MNALVERFRADETGAIGDGLINAGISPAIIAVLDGAGTRLNSKFKSIDHCPKYDERRA